jgi:hypothetical protein
MYPTTKNREAAGWPAVHALADPAPDGRAGRPEIGEQTDELLKGIGFSAEEIAPLRLSTGILKGSAQRHPLDRALPRSHRIA